MAHFSRFRSQRILTFCAFVFLFAESANAGSPARVTADGDPVSWGENPTVSYHPESGSCSSYSNLEMIALVDDALDMWDDLTEASLTITAVTGSIGDINGDNFETYIYTGSGTSTNNATLTDGLNPMAFDDDGEITAAFAGESNKMNVLGFAGPTIYDTDTGEIEDAIAVINCLCVEDHPSQSPCSSGGLTFEIDENQLVSTVVHEFGHLLGLDHSQVNSDLYENGNDADDVDLPIMFPLAFSSTIPVALTTDDKQSLAQLYASDDYVADSCFIRGKVLDVDGQELRCADIQAVPSDISDTVSFVSGALALAEDKNDDDDTVDNGECESDCGEFMLYLTPGRDYTLKVMPIHEEFTGGSGLSPCINEQSDDIIEEEILEISGVDCEAGETSDLGNIQTQSEGGGSSSGGGSSGGSSSSGGFGESAENPIGYWCGLNPGAGNPLTGALVSFLGLG